MSITTHGDLYDYNIMKSVERFVRDSGITLTYSVAFENTEYNPSDQNRWIEFEWVYFGPSVFTSNSLHVRCFSRSTDDKYGRKRELMIGTVKNMMAGTTGYIPFLDVMNYPDDPEPIRAGGDRLQMAIRFADRSTMMDGENMGEATQIQGVHLVVLNYNVHVARTHEQH